MMAVVASVATETPEQRRYPRARLTLCVRLRWPTAFGLVTELAETLDASRGGFLFFRHEPCEPGASLWVTFPWDASVTQVQPEIPARVARVKVTPAGGYLVAVTFETSRPGAPAAALGELRAAPAAGDRRQQPRFPLALPIRVRAQDWPWPEETMTLDISGRGVLVETPRIYSPGAIVRVVLPYGSWVSAGEVPARVVRVEPVPGSVTQRVALALLPLEKESRSSEGTR